jgi:hypothetical protein
VCNSRGSPHICVRPELECCPLLCLLFFMMPRHRPTPVSLSPDGPEYTKRQFCDEAALHPSRAIYRLTFNAVYPVVCFGCPGTCDGKPLTRGMLCLGDAKSTVQFLNEYSELLSDGPGVRLPASYEEFTPRRSSSNSKRLSKQRLMAPTAPVCRGFAYALCCGSWPRAACRTGSRGFTASSSGRTRDFPLLG